MNLIPTDAGSTDEEGEYDVESWPRDFDFRLSRAEQQELLRNDENTPKSE